MPHQKRIEDFSSDDQIWFTVEMTNDENEKFAKLRDAFNRLARQAGADGLNIHVEKFKVELTAQGQQKLDNKNRKIGDGFFEHHALADKGPFFLFKITTEQPQVRSPEPTALAATFSFCASQMSFTPDATVTLGAEQSKLALYVQTQDFSAAGNVCSVVMGALRHG